MPIRLSGLVSGMDTESIVKELMKAENLKKNKIQNKITTLQWKQDKWKDLNSKIYSFYTGSLSKLRLQGSFNTLKASSSNESKVEVSASGTAPAGTHTLQIKQLASGQFVTGSPITTTSGKAVTASTKLTDLGLLASEGTTITINTGGKTKSLDINAYSTVQDFIDTCKNAGLNASFDTNQNRFFISSKESGTQNAFFITTSSTAITQERNQIRDAIDYNNMTYTQKNTVDSALLAYINPASTAGDKTKAQSNILAAYDTRVSAKYITDYTSNQANIDRVTASELDRLTTANDGIAPSDSVLQAAVKTELAKEANAAADAEYAAWKDTTNPAPDTNVFKAAENKLNTLLSDYTAASGAELTQTNSLSKLGLSEISKDTDGTALVEDPSIISFIEAKNADIIYNNAELTSSSNTMTVNGMTFTLKGTTSGFDTVGTADDEVITLNASKDTQAVYNMIKDFVKSYDDLLKTMTDDYDAPLAKGYEPLTDDQKASMTDKQIEDWEKVIKDSLLRRDDNISSITGSMRTLMISSVNVDGKNYSLASLGISSVNYTEKGQLHIDGDADDALVSGKENELMKALNEDPDKVMKVFSKIAGDIYSDLQDKMKSTTLRSALTFYNDKEMKNTMDDYNEELKNLEKRLQDTEDRYYKQFSAMESAMSKANSQSSSLASMLGSK